MQKLLLPAALLLTGLLSACGGGKSTAATVDLTGDTSIFVGESVKLSSVVRDASGKAIVSAVTYTSSQPNVISVDDKGNLTVKRLSATDKPVVITATSGGKTDTLEITTYGLEMAIGTQISSFQKAGDAPGLHWVARFRTESGVMEKTKLTLKNPNGKVTEFDVSGGTSTISYNISSPLAAEADAENPNGEWQVSLINQGLTYTAKASIANRDQVLGLVKNIKVSNQARAITISGEAPVGTKSIRTTTYDQTQTIYVPSFSTSLPINFNVPSTVAAGTYSTALYVRSCNPYTFAQVLDETCNLSLTYAGQVTLP